jgi:eukaryotic-like serine/threonine-protein kinase
MALTSGDRLGPYEILAAIGAGGMGEVYRARDTKLGRDVAIKVLPEAFARDAERMARFQREAKVLASLNHPNIATIHGLEDSGNTHALVMELVEGPTLADRIKKGSIPIDEALRIAKQICEALEYAHERGIVHRDLKPANVKVTTDDAVKILDFGLAKALEGDAASMDISTSPTISRLATMQGVLLGTAAYMSPEQAKGKSVDRRADIWAFGCVLYEMLTGHQIFTGEAVTDTLASVIKEEPDWSRLPAGTPVRVRVLLQRCLQKDPKQRLRDIGDARISLDEVLSGAPDPALAGAPQAAAPLWRRALPWAVALLLFVTLAPIAFLYFRQAPAAPAKLVRFQIPLPEKTTFGISGNFALSPDGRQLAFTAIGADAVQRLWLRSFDSLEARVLSGADLGSNPTPPFFWSPDSRFIAFEAHGELQKIDVSGGPAQTLCDVRGEVGGSWNRDGVIIFAESPGPVMRVSADGGPATPVTAFDPSRGDITDVFPVFLPDGRHFIYIHNSATPADGGSFVGSLDAKPEEQPVKKLAGLPELYAPSSDPDYGYLFSLRNGALVVQTFDNKRMEATGEPVALDGQPSVVGVSTSDTGVLVYRTGIQVHSDPEAIVQGQLTWFDRQGKTLGGLGDPGLYRSLAISPDGKRVAFERVDPQTGGRNIWLYELARGVATRFTFDPVWDSDPVWSPDGSRIAFAALRGGPTDLYVKATNLSGQDELLFKSDDYKAPISWSPDGKFLLYESGTTEATSHVWALPLKGGPGDRKPVALVADNFAEASSRLSPNGRWIAYQSNESGRDEIYVQAFAISSAAGAPPAVGTPTGKWQVSKGGGISPLWRRDGKELFYLSPDGMAMAVEVSGSGGFQAGVPKTLFKVPSGVVYWDVTSDGKRFLMPAPSATGPQSPFTVMLNWQAGLKK